MNSTDPQAAAELVRQFFEAEVLPLHRRFRDTDQRFFELSADPDLDSYYARREKVSCDKRDFEVGGYRDKSELAQALAEMWTDQEALLRLASAVATLAEATKDHAPQSDEISPLIYVMF